MNRYDVKCAGCGATYIDRVFNRLSFLLHPGVRGPEDQTSPVPTKKCVRVYSYVNFFTCGHCCPESFRDCPECVLNHPNTNITIGTRTDEKCNCRT
jgi:hypothetical protein